MFKKACSGVLVQGTRYGPSMGWCYLVRCSAVVLHGAAASRDFLSESFVTISRGIIAKAWMTSQAIALWWSERGDRLRAIQA